MHFRLPKPLHGWRAFAGEVGIIVLGVLIALAAEQVVANLHWRHKVGVIRQSLMGELGNDRARWESNMSQVPCAKREVAALDEWAKRASPGAAAPATPQMAYGLFWWMHWANWNLASSGDTLDHFPITEQLEFASLYDGIKHREADIETATDLGQQVHGLIPLADDAAGRRELRAVLARLAGKIQAVAQNDSYMRRHFDAVGVKPDRSDFAADDADAPQCKG